MYWPFWFSAVVCDLKQRLCVKNDFRKIFSSKCLFIFVFIRHCLLSLQCLMWNLIFWGYSLLMLSKYPCVYAWLLLAFTHFSASELQSYLQWDWFSIFLNFLEFPGYQNELKQCYNTMWKFGTIEVHRDNITLIPNSVFDIAHIIFRSFENGLTMTIELVVTCIHAFVWYDVIWYDMIWYDMIWYDMIWYDMIWYDMIWYMILYDII